MRSTFTLPQDKQRPPIYNPEDYVTSLRKWGKKCTNTAALYPDLEPAGAEQKSRTLPNQTKDFRNPCLNGGEEMSLRQFGSASELLAKLRADLRLAFPSFVQEFACEPLDGVTLLLELLRNVQLNQTGDGKGPPTVRRRPLLDELACLQCLWSCCARYPDGVRRAVAAAAGVYTLTVSIMSTVNKSRVLALQVIDEEALRARAPISFKDDSWLPLLTKVCHPPANGHDTVSEALSTLRLKYGEPVRFRFLVGMLQSAGGSGELQAAGLTFINALLVSAPSPQKKLYIQAELEQAGFDIITLKKMVSKLPTVNGQVTREIENYEKQLIDIDILSEQANEMKKEKDDLRQKLELLEKKVKILQEEKGILLSLEKCLKEKCCELQEEVTSLRSEHGNSNRKKSFMGKKKISVHKSRDECSPPEDEGISSSERSLSPEGDHERESIVYEVFNVKNETFDIIRNKRMHKKLESTKKNFEIMNKKPSDDEEETTIDEVIQELRNIVNDAESEQFAKDRMAYVDNNVSNQPSEINVSIKANECSKHKDIDKEDSITSTKHSIHITGSTEFLNDLKDDDDEESEIVPTNILPRPPRKSKSLIHLFTPPVDQGLVYNKPPDLYDDLYSSDEGSDSLLSASRYLKKVSKKPSVSSFDFNECRALFKTLAENDEETTKFQRTRSKSKDESQKRTSVKRSESFQNSEKGSRQRDYIDSLFCKESQCSVSGSGKNHLERSNSKCSRVDEIVNLIESKKLTKSLDRIDEGLNTMVDIVMMSEIKEPEWPYQRRQRSISAMNSDTSNEKPLIPVKRSNSKRSTNGNSRSNDFGKLDQQKFYLPHPKLSTGSFDNHSSSSYNNNSAFIVKRGHTNAGFYSGTNILRDAPASMTSLFVSHNHADLKRTLSPGAPKSMSSVSIGTPKVTDMPSGLY
ncbi:hypothetical protein EVAR_49793_1 [Eumeta japonica]|uniref:GBD/FH3 domain-containing protein n=1 Tax=Eumeta variegata TaxID=151549 RepID=A0A4C1YVP9_EUMVA|nr:hypothetical protein EVAR_49793_1 [Eumeta japonica]